MNTLRRLLFTILVVTLLVGALAMPASVAAAKPIGQTRALWVTPEIDAKLNAGPVLVQIPANATRGMQPFLLTMTVWQDANGYTVELGPAGAEFRAPVLLSFGPHIRGATGENVGPLNPAPRSEWRGNQPAFWVEHFSRYSGWF